MLGASIGYKPDHAAFRDLIDARFRADEEKIPFAPAKTGDTSTYFRASSLGKRCGRKEALKIVHKKTSIEEIKPELLYLFAKGHAYHWMHQENILPLIAKDGLLGWWVGPDSMLTGSNDDGSPKLWTMAEAAEKMGCKTHQLQYKEVHAYDHVGMIKGHPDAILDWSRLNFSHDDHPDGLEILEFKTRHDSTWMWDAIDPYLGGQPLKDHVLQVQIYMLMTGIKHARIIYMKKGDNEYTDGLKYSYVEWRVESDPKVQAKIRKFLTAWWQVIEKAYGQGYVPPRKVCSAFTKGKATSCALRYLCFDKKPSKKKDNLRDCTPDEVQDMKKALEEMLDIVLGD